MINQLKKVNAIQTTDTMDLVKKSHCNTKLGEIKKKILGHDHRSKYITTKEFN